MKSFDIAQRPKLQTIFNGESQPKASQDSGQTGNLGGAMPGTHQVSNVWSYGLWGNCSFVRSFISFSSSNTNKYWLPRVEFQIVREGDSAQCTVFVSSQWQYPRICFSLKKLTERWESPLSDSPVSPSSISRSSSLAGIAIFSSYSWKDSPIFRRSALNDPTFHSFLESADRPNISYFLRDGVPYLDCSPSITSFSILDSRFAGI